MEFIPVFFQTTVFSQRRGREYGFSVYQNVMVWWDEDYDQRVFSWIDSLSIKSRTYLYAVQEAKGTLSLVWRKKPHWKYRVGAGVDVLGDYWTIVESSILVTQEHQLLYLPKCNFGQSRDGMVQ